MKTAKESLNARRTTRMICLGLVGGIALLAMPASANHEYLYQACEFDPSNPSICEAVVTNVYNICHPQFTFCDAPNNLCDNAGLNATGAACQGYTSARSKVCTAIQPCPLPTP